MKSMFSLAFAGLVAFAALKPATSYALEFKDAAIYHSRNARGPWMFYNLAIVPGNEKVADFLSTLKSGVTYDCKVKYFYTGGNLGASADMASVFDVTDCKARPTEF